jgi:ABC-2 type transport system ATP-binding protein
MGEATGVPIPNVVRVESLSRRFGKNVAVDDVTFEVARGRVFGLVGENGAGKTTLIRLMLGLLKPTMGRVSVFGLNPVNDPEGVLARIGYLSEDRDLPGWMRVSELLRYTRAFYPQWDDAYADELIRTFALDPKAKVKTLSRGQKAQAGLLIALAYRPELLLLDEPSSGLDVVVRRHILAAIIRTVADEGRTVLFSSHLLDEVERVADDVVMIHEGKLVLCGPLDTIKAGHRRITLRFNESVARPPAFPRALSCEGSGREWTVICNENIEETHVAIQNANAGIIEEVVPSLEDIFVAHVGTGFRQPKED